MNVNGVETSHLHLDAINIHFFTEEGYSILAETYILRFLSQWQQF